MARQLLNALRMGLALPALAVLSSTSGRLVADWGEYNERGVWLGPRHATVVVTEFMDFTCSHCRALAPIMDSLRKSYPSDIAVVFQHFPLADRLSSRQIAVAAECAGSQGLFEDMAEALFRAPVLREKEDFSRVASSVGIPDSAAFSTCMERPYSSFERIHAGRAIGRQIGIPGTPTLWINGRVSYARTYDELVAAAEKAGLSIREVRR